MENDELARHLESLQRENCYRVDAVLKQSPAEITQRVYFVGSNGAENGPFIRKFIQCGSGLGSIYERLYDAQRSGRRFKYIPDMIECYTRDDQQVIVMECVLGQTLQEAVYESDPSVDFAKTVFPRLCDAVWELHTEFDPPIIHRDLKPSNIILTGEGLALIDFGISREYHQGAVSDTTHFGTREFAPPEQYGFGQTTVQSDVYSLGMVLYFCLTETIPDAAARERGFADPRIPENMRQVIAKAVALDPAHRFANAADLKRAFLEAAEALQREQLDSAEQTTAASQQSAAPKKRGVAPIAIAAIVACIVVAFVGFFAVAPLFRASDEAREQNASDSSETSVELSAASATSSASAASVADEAMLPFDELAGGFETSAPPKDGFDPSTNSSISIAGLEFQIPQYYLENTRPGEGSTTYYYAEQGASVAMLMTNEIVLDLPLGTSEEEIASDMDDYMKGIMDSDKEVFAELVSSKDFKLAGYAARVATTRGEAQGKPVMFKLVVFFEPGSAISGSIILSLTDNVNYDYLPDFAKIISSATPA